MDRIAGVTILYYPNQTTIENILSYYDDVDELFVMDNSPEENISIKQLSNTTLHYFHDGENRGIAERLNQSVKLATEKGFEWLLTMDQDSYFERGVLKEYKKQIEKYSNNDFTAVFGVNYSTTNEKTITYSEVPLLITSGSIINLDIAKHLGLFDENLFIDEVDSEYCYRARINHFKIIECSQVFLHHILGEMQMGRSLKSGKLTPRRLHAPIRIYYMVRNYFYVRKKLPLIPVAEQKEMRRGLLVRIKNNLIYNAKRWQVLKYILKGYFDFKNNKMGKIDS